MNLLAGAVAGLAILVLQLPADVFTDAPNEYVKAREFVSPLTEDRFIAYVLKAPLNPSSYDYDQCPHTPVNTLAYTLVIDPETGYVDYPETFAHTHLTQQRVVEIVGLPRFSRNAPESLPWQDAYPWEKLENAANLAAAENAAALDVANWWLMAAWSVRLDVISGDNEFDSEVEQLFAQMPRRAPDLSNLNVLYEIRLAEQWIELHEAGQLFSIEENEFAIAIAWLYRSRGELLAAQDWLDRKYTIGQDSGSTVLRDYLASSIELERSYLENAKPLFIRGWNDGGLSQMEEGPIAYLIAEICRRLGELESASYWYGLAAERNYGGMSQELISRQTSVAANGRGY